MTSSYFSTKLLRSRFQIVHNGTIFLTSLLIAALPSQLSSKTRQIHSHSLYVLLSSFGGLHLLRSPAAMSLISFSFWCFLHILCSSAPTYAASHPVWVWYIQPHKTAATDFCKMLLMLAAGSIASSRYHLYPVKSLPYAAVAVVQYSELSKRTLEA